MGLITEPEHVNKGFSFDGTINVPTIIALCAVLFGGIITYANIDAGNKQRDSAIFDMKTTISQIVLNNQQNSINQAKLTQIVEDMQRKETYDRPK